MTTEQYKVANASYRTRQQAEQATKSLPHPYNWYVWQMNDGSWQVSLLTR